MKLSLVVMISLCMILYGVTRQLGSYNTHYVQKLWVLDSKQKASMTGVRIVSMEKQWKGFCFLGHIVGWRCSINIPYYS